MFTLALGFVCAGIGYVVSGHSVAGAAMGFVIGAVVGGVISVATADYKRPRR